MGRVFHLLAGHQRQIQKHRIDRKLGVEGARHHRIAGVIGGFIDARLGAHGLDHQAFAQLHPVDAVAVGADPQHITRPQMRGRGRQGKAHAIA